jgi:hypothetical protein
MAIPSVHTVTFHSLANLFRDSKNRESSDISVHRKLFDACRPVFHRVALLVSDDVPVNSQRDAWVTVP